MMGHEEQDSAGVGLTPEEVIRHWSFVNREESRVLTDDGIPRMTDDDLRITRSRMGMFYRKL